MPPSYQLSFKIRAEHVDFRRQMTLSSLMGLFQRCCITHTEELGMGRDKTLDKGFLWIVTSERFLIHRLPHYDEDIVVECHPGKTLHFFFPRHITLSTEEGEVLVQGVSIWSLISQSTRSFIDPGKNGIHIEGEDLITDLAPKMNLPMPALESKASLLASPSKVDINGHLNNASYCDFCIDLLEEKDLKNGNVREMAVQFKKELPLFEQTEVSYGKKDEAYYFSSPHFALVLDYRR